MPDTTVRPAEHLDPAIRRLAGILVLGALAPLLDSTIVSIALHTLGHDLGASTTSLQWVSTAYLLALATVVPVSGWAVERFDSRSVWLGALTLFLAGSLLCGLAWNIGSLIAFRVVQGIGGGLLLPVLQTLVMRAAGGRSLGRLMAVITLPAMVVPILGPVVGGLIVGHLSWRWIFYVNLPVCLLALALAWRGVPKDTPRPGHRLDLTGLLLLSPASPPWSTACPRPAWPARRRSRWAPYSSPCSPATHCAPANPSSIYGCSRTARSPSPRS